MMVTLTAVISRMSLKRMDAKVPLVICKSFAVKTERSASHNTKNATTEKNAQTDRTKMIAVSYFISLHLVILRHSSIMSTVFGIFYIEKFNLPLSSKTTKKQI